MGGEVREISYGRGFPYFDSEGFGNGKDALYVPCSDARKSTLRYRNLGSRLVFVQYSLGAGGQYRGLVFTG